MDVGQLWAWTKGWSGWAINGRVLDGVAVVGMGEMIAG